MHVMTVMMMLRVYHHMNHLNVKLSVNLTITYSTVTAILFLLSTSMSTNPVGIATT